MAQDARKRQHKQEKREAKRKEKRRALAKESNLGLAGQLAAAERYPILHCWRSATLVTEGIGQVCLSRALPDGRVGYALFLVDRYCLGVKNVYAGVTSRFDYDSRIRKVMHGEIETTPAAARKYVEAAVAYARGLGLAPHADYAAASRIFGSIDASTCNEEFEFGKDGQPYFISGPHDTPEKCRRILAALNRSVGAGHYHYLVAISGVELDEIGGRLLPDPAAPHRIIDVTDEPVEVYPRDQ